MRLAFLVPFVGTASAAVIEHWWNISRTLANPDGLFERSVIGVNGTWPPPAISAIQGDIIKIHAFNGLGDAKVGTALHAHGMFFNGTNYYDGAVGVTQCSIPSETGMDYIIDTSLQTGTYWIHGHYLGQYTDGLRAPLIIHPKNETGRGDNVTWDEEYTLVVSDWYHRQHFDLLSEFMDWKNPTGAEPVPGMSIEAFPSWINGAIGAAGIRLMVDSAAIYVLHKDQYLPSAEAIRTGEGVNDNAKLHFQPGKTYKIRIVNMSALAMFYIALDQHDIYVIETDGIEVEPYKLDVVTISVAQRYSILVTAKNETNLNYAMSIMQAEEMYDVIPDDLVLNNTLQIVYDDSNLPAQKVVYEGWPVLDDTEFVPVLKKEMAPADIEYTLNVWFDTYDDGSNRGSFNNVTYREPPTPSFFTALTMGNDSFNPAVYGHQTNAIPYPHGANIQLTVYNWDDGFHPFHFHGHEFQVVGKSFDVTSDDVALNPPLAEGQKNPARRDTITIPPSGKVVIRWRADNPGAWFFHCHVDWHLSSGLAVVFIEAPEKLQENPAAPRVLYDQCQYWGLPTSGNVVGKNSTSDFTGQPWGPFPLVMNWTPKAIATMIACIASAIIGFGTVIWYASGDLDETEIEEEVKRKMEAKQAKKERMRRLVGI